MKLLGFDIAIHVKRAGPLAPVDSRGSWPGGGGWWPVVHEPYAGAWQRNDPLTADTMLAFHAVYACITRIANAIGKMPIELKQVDDDGIWTDATSAAFTPVLKRPNRFQNHIQFKQWWITSKLTAGNAYALKERDARGVVVKLYLLEPSCVLPLVAPDGSVFYQLRTDNLAGIQDTDVTVPASEIIHDRMNCLFHPLVGVSPLYAAGLAAGVGLKIMNDSAQFFANGGAPGGVLTAPGAIGDDTAKRLQEKWSANYGGANAGKIAVMGDGLKFEAMKMTYADSQLIEQLKWTSDVVCSVFGVPPFKIGMGTIPAGMKVGDLNQLFYEDALHCLIEEMEQCMDDGLALPPPYRTELDLDTLLRMDQATQADTLVKLVGGGISAPNEARARMNLPPLTGGATVYLQQQQYSIEALAERDADKPFAKPPAPAPAPQGTPAGGASEEDAGEQARALLEYVREGIAHAAA